MNPFDLSGPPFLLLYVLLGAGFIGVLWFLRVAIGWRSTSQGRLTDPLDIALLRRGPIEPIRIATLSLVERSLLSCSDDGKVHATHPAQSMDDPLEQAILLESLIPIQAYRLVGNPHLRRQLDLRIKRMRQSGLIPTAQERLQQVVLTGLATSLIVAFGTARIVVSVERGHDNIGFLIILVAVVLICGVLSMLRPIRATALAHRSLKELRTLFQPVLRMSRTPNQEQTVFLAALFGTEAFHPISQATFRRLFPKSRAEGPMLNASGTGCGSACASGSGAGGSGCSGGGSGCGGGGSGCGGGGGCGGGCGGG